MTTASAKKATSLDKATTFSFAIVVLLLSTATGGAVYLSTLNTTVLRIDKTLDEVRRSLDDVGKQLSSEGREIAVLKSQIDALLRRVRDLETK